MPQPKRTPYKTVLTVPIPHITPTTAATYMPQTTAIPAPITLYRNA